MGARAPRLCLLLSCFCLLRVEPAAELEFKRTVQHQGEKGCELDGSGARGAFGGTGLDRVVEKRKMVCERGGRHLDSGAWDQMLLR